MHLGQYDAVGLSEARKKAGDYWKLARGGKDPADHKADEIKDRRKKEALTFKRVAKHYLGFHRKWTIGLSKGLICDLRATEGEGEAALQVEN
jgi:hypothetical protein